MTTERFRPICLVEELSSQRTTVSQMQLSSWRTTLSGSKLVIVSEPRWSLLINKLEVNKFIESLMCEFSKCIGSRMSRMILDEAVLSIIISAVISTQLHLDIIVVLCCVVFVLVLFSFYYDRFKIYTVIFQACSSCFIWFISSVLRLGSNYVMIHWNDWSRISSLHSIHIWMLLFSIFGKKNLGRFVTAE